MGAGRFKEISRKYGENRPRQIAPKIAGKSRTGQARWRLHSRARWRLNSRLITIHATWNSQGRARAEAAPRALATATLPPYRRNWCATSAALRCWAPIREVSSCSALTSCATS
eukprot:6552623-Prymnesium_polylepis.1